MIKKFAKLCLRGGLRLYSDGKGELPVMAGPLRGCKILKNYGLQNLSMLFGKYEQQFANSYYVYVKNARVIYDIGANIGYFSLLGAMNNSAKIIAFEPVPAIAKEFHQLMLINGVSNRVELAEYALSDEAGEVLMVTPGSAETNVMDTALRGQKINKDDGIRVPMITLDEFVFEKKHQPPDLIKLDVEGAEVLVLKGGTTTIATFRPVILAEIHGHEPADGVWDYVCEHNYSLRVITAGDESRVENKEQWMSYFRRSRWAIVHVVLTP